MPGIGVGVSPSLGGKKLQFGTYWTTLMDVLWIGDMDGDTLVDVSGNGNDITILNNDFTAYNYIPATSSSTFLVPDTATLIADDTDKIWFDVVDENRAVSVLELISYDFARTLVWYDDASPHHIRAIGILKSAVTLSASQINLLHSDFKLAIFWSDELNEFGYLKANKGFAQSVWSLP